jgi:hypothetical protein
MMGPRVLNLALKDTLRKNLRLRRLAILIFLLENILAACVSLADCAVAAFPSFPEKENIRNTADRMNKR